MAIETEICTLIYRGITVRQASVLTEQLQENISETRFHNQVKGWYQVEFNFTKTRAAEWGKGRGEIAPVP